MLTLLLINMLTLVFNAQSVEIIERIYIRADGSIDPSTANITSVDNVTYTFTDNNYYSIWVERSNIVIDGAGYTVESNGDGYGFRLFNIRNVTVKNTSIKNFYIGIYLRLASNNIISENNITENNFGISLFESSNNTISENNITKTKNGINIYFSSNNSLSENMMNYNGLNLYVEGGELSHFLHSIDVSNLVNGKPIYYLSNQKDLIIKPATHPQVGYLALINCRNATIENLNLTNNGQGLLLAYTNNSRIIDNNITNNDCGVLLWHSSNNSISGNNITANRETGIYVTVSSDNNISENNITSNFRGGLVLRQSFNSQLIGNIITNCYYGLFLSSSYNNSIYETNVSNNMHGIHLAGSSNNTISESNITKTSRYGISLKDSSNNKFYHNNFLTNLRTSISNSSNNVWDDGYPSGGNYWSDYDYRYPDAHELDGSGIWDTPYVIDENNQDNYPLMNPWTPSPPIPPPPPTIATVDVNPNTLNLKSKGRWITVHIELPEGYNVSNIDRSTILLNDTIPVDSFWLDKPLESVIGDYDNDGITDLMVKFDRQALIEYIETKGITNAEVTLAITGKANGKSFEVTDTIKVIGQ